MTTAEMATRAAELAQAADSGSDHEEATLCAMASIALSLAVLAAKSVERPAHFTYVDDPR